MKKLLISTLLLFTFTSLFAANKNLIFKESYTDIKNLNFQLRSENVTIKEIYGDEISVEVYSNNKHLMPEINNTKANLVIKSNNKSFRFGEYCNLEICIPQDYKFNAVAIKHTSGDLNIENMIAENISIYGTSGSLHADTISANYKLDLQSTSGSTKIKKASSDELEIISTSGSIQIEKINTIESKISVTSGSVNFEKLDTESFDITSTSGSIKISNISCDYFTATSTSGSTMMEFENAPTATSRIRTTSGSIKLYFLSNEGFDLTFSTNSGSYTDSINNDRSSPHGTITRTFFGGGPDLIVSTTSGSLLIDE